MTGHELSQVAFGSRRVDTPPDRETWLKLRGKGLGASDAAAVFGASPWRSPYALWLEKSENIAKDLDENEYAAAGIRHEPTIAQWFSEQPIAAGHEVLDPGPFTMVWADSSTPIYSTLDRVLVDGISKDPWAVVELKCAWGKSAKQWDRGVPLGYQVQMSTQMLCTGMRTAFVVCLLDGYRFRWHKLQWSEKFATVLEKKLTQFWTQYVVPKIPPPADYSKATTDALNAQWSDPKPDSVDLDYTFYDIHTKRETAAGEVKRWQKEVDLCSNQLRAAIGDHTLGILHDGETGYSWQPNKFGTRTLRKVKVKQPSGV